MITPLPADSLRWRCDPASLPFETTDDVEPIQGVVGQPSAVEALRFGLECDARGQNVFIRGLSGTGRMTLVQRLLAELRPMCKAKHDRCYVHNFAQPERPRLITLPAGSGRPFRRRVREFNEFIRDGLRDALSTQAVKARRESLERREHETLEGVTEPFEKALKDAGLALVHVQVGPVAQTAIFPAINGKPVPPEEFDQLREKGKISEEQYAQVRERIASFQKRLEEVTEEVHRIRRLSARAIFSVIEETARMILGNMARNILAEFPGEDVSRFLSEIVDDVADKRLGGSPEEQDDPVRAYGVNVLVEHEVDENCPIVVENTPTLSNLLGTIDRDWTQRGPAPTDYASVRAGSLMRADGGYLIMEARDVLMEPGAWKMLMRTLRTEMLEIVPSEFMWPMWAQSVKPEPIPIDVKVILLGDSSIYYLLDRYDADFPHLFKVLADFDTEIDRRPDGPTQYASVLTRIAREEKLPPFHRTAVAALVEHGARIVARRGKLSTRFSRIADIAREAAFLARKESAPHVTGQHVVDAVAHAKRRADLPSRRFRELLKDGTLRVEVRGRVVGQINGLAVLSAGPLVYGIPARITASMGAGSAGIINIEGQAQLSGAIHTKGFHILGGLLRHLLRTDHPLAFSASLAFEQSYGSIDGDSASCAEICCLLSALTNVPIRQDIAMTGSIDQIGHVQVIGGVNEKIEGFFDACSDSGLSGSQGVIIPKGNAGDLMLRPDVVEACAAGKFRVYAVETVHEALEVLTGMPAGRRDEEGLYPEGTLLHLAVEKAREFWQRSLLNPGAFQEEEEEGEGEPAEEGEPEEEDA